MKAALLKGVRNIEVTDIDVPEPKPDEILIKILYSLTCGTDLKAYERGHPYIKYPVVLGHEYVGEIVKKGRDVKNFEIGEIVTGANSAPCFNCFYCNKAQYNLCENIEDVLIGFKLNGCFSEYMIVPGRIVKVNLFKVEEKDFKKYAMLEPLACVIHAVNILHIQENENVLIIGSGPMGILLSQVCKNITNQVFLLGKHMARIKIAERLGIKTINIEENYEEEVKRITSDYGFDVVIEAVGTLDAWNLAFKLVRKGGKLMYFGGLKRGLEINLDAYKIHYGEIKIFGSFHHDPNSVKEAYNIIKQNKIQIQSLITEEMKLPDIEKALLSMAEGKNMKVGIVMD
jgi:Threonine dehydrogenase and related Zn-dependent dehydrogenases